MRVIGTLILVVLLIFSCKKDDKFGGGTQEDLIGKWVIVIPDGMETAINECKKLNNIQIDSLGDGVWERGSFGVNDSCISKKENHSFIVSNNIIYISGRPEHQDIDSIQGYFIDNNTISITWRVSIWTVSTTTTIYDRSPE